MLRWIARLEEKKLIYRAADSSDARRRHVRLTDEGRSLMRTILRSISSAKII